MSYTPQFFSTSLGDSVGRGRGIPALRFDSPVQRDDVNVVGDSQDVAEAPIVSGDSASSQSHHIEHTPLTQVTDTSSAASTPQSPMVVSQMSDVIRDVGQLLADSILARLGPMHTAPTPSISQAQATSTNTSTQSLDLSQVQFVPHRKVKEPPAFRGDSTDAVNVHEWEDLMRGYIKKTNISVEQQAEEILTHLRGRAKDVVKFGTRNSGIDITQNPEAIYGLLRKHFATVPCSPLPLADFYATLPKSGEDAYDYWLRLNRAADIAADRLKEQGKALDSPVLEATRMFIRNCPSKELVMTFRSKTIDKWSAEEVQAVLDEYHSEVSSKCGATAVSRKPDDVHVNRVGLIEAEGSSPSKQDCQAAKTSESSALERVISMLEKVLLDKSAPAQAMSNRQPKPKLPRIEGLNSLPCTVCGDAAHSGLSHCRDNKLCFQCHTPDHGRRSCPLFKSAQPAQAGN